MFLANLIGFSIGLFFPIYFVKFLNEETTDISEVSIKKVE